MSEPDLPAASEPQPTVKFLDLVIAGIADFSATTVRESLTDLVRTKVEPAPEGELELASEIRSEMGPEFEPDPAITEDPPAQEPLISRAHAPVVFLALVGVALLATVLAHRKSR